MQSGSQCMNVGGSLSTKASVMNAWVAYYVRPEAWIQVFELRSVCPDCGRPLTVWRHKVSEKTVQCRDGANNVEHLAELY
jgi:hypothetical protein